MESHYNNPVRSEGEWEAAVAAQHLGPVVDNSGLKLLFTPAVRKHDAGVLSIGKCGFFFARASKCRPCVRACLGGGADVMRGKLNFLSWCERSALVEGLKLIDKFTRTGECCACDLAHRIAPTEKTHTHA